MCIYAYRHMDASPKHKQDRFLKVSKRGNITALGDDNFCIKPKIMALKKCNYYSESIGSKYSDIANPLYS